MSTLTPEERARIERIRADHESDDAATGNDPDPSEWTPTAADIHGDRGDLLLILDRLLAAPAGTVQEDTAYRPGLPSVESSTASAGAPRGQFTAQIAMEGTMAETPKKLPVIPPIPEPGQVDTNPAVAICGACGLEIRQVMGLACFNPRCPFQARVTI